MNGIKVEDRAFMDALHCQGVLLVIMATSTRWAGIWRDSADLYWLCEGEVVPAEQVSRGGVHSNDHCFERSYGEALVTFRDWWDKDFVGPPQCSGGKGIRPVN